MQWLNHFRASANRPRAIDWQLGVQLEPQLRRPVLEALQTFQRGLTSPGINIRTKVRRSCEPEYAECIDHYVAEAAWQMNEGSICGLGQAAPLPLTTALQHFPGDFEDSPS